MTYLIIIFAICFLGLSIYKYEWAVFLILLFLPAYQIRFNLLGIPSTLLELMILTVFFVWFIKNARQVIENIKIKLNKSHISNRKSQIVRYPFDYEIIALLVISFITLIITGMTNSALGIWKAYIFEPILLFIVILNMFRMNPDRDVIINKALKLIVLPLALSIWCISIVAVGQRAHIVYSPENFFPRVTGPYPYPNALGLFVAPIIMLLIGMFFSKYKFRFHTFTFKELLLPIILILSGLAIYFARSEGALIAVLFALVIFAFWAEKIYRKLALITIALGMLSFFGMYYLTYQNARLARGEIDACLCQKIPAITNISNKIVGKLTLSDLSGEIRKQQWRETWQMMTESPKRFIFGTGLSGYQKAVEPYHQEGIFFNKENDPDFERKIVIFDDKYRAEHWQPVEIYMYPHNIILNFWTELGIAGMLVFIWIFVKFFYIAVKLLITEPKRDDKFIIVGLFCSMLVIVIHGLVDVPYFKNDLSVIFWTLLAFLGTLKVQTSLTLEQPKTEEKN